MTLPQGGFDTQLARFRVDYSFNTRMFLNSFVQCNSATSSWLTNIRYRFIYRPLSDFYLVYNDTRSAGRTGQRTVALKHTLMLAFWFGDRPMMSPDRKREPATKRPR